MAGTVMAVDMSLSSGLRTISPLIGGQLVQRHGFPGVCVTAAVVLLTAFATASFLQPGKGARSEASEAEAEEQRGVGQRDATSARATVGADAELKKSR